MSKPTGKNLSDRAQRRLVRESAWEHVDFEDAHPVEPHYTFQGGWSCYICKQRIRIVAFIATRLR